MSRYLTSRSACGIRGEYQRFGDERSRPFFDLLGRVGAEAPGRGRRTSAAVPGTLTATLARRWPRRRGPRDRQLGRDDRGRARRCATRGRAAQLRARRRRDWEPDGRVDVIVSNAVLQWVPEHLGVLARWAGFLAAGRLAGVPGPRQLRPAEPRDTAGARRLGPVAPAARRRAAEPPGGGSSPVPRPARRGRLRGRRVGDDLPARAARRRSGGLDWYKGTGLRPVLAALPPSQAPFLADYRARIAEAYPAGLRYGVPVPPRVRRGVRRYRPADARTRATAASPACLPLRLLVAQPLHGLGR